MSLEDDVQMFGFGEGCAVHGDEYMKECTMCGAEFCVRCHPRSALCPDCSEGGLDVDDDDDQDFEDVDDLDALLGDDKDMDKILDAAEEMPPDAFDEEERGD